MKRLVALCALVAFVLALAPTAFGAGGNERDTFVQLLAINDFHGNLQPPSGSSGRIAVGPGGATVNAGGIEYLATWIKSLRTTNPNTITIGAGDLIGASPLISGLFHDEPTIEAMNAIGLDVTGVGNHEFDEGIAELLRMQFGNQLGGNGCHPVDGCQDGTPFGGSLFQYLAANVFYEHTNNTILPPYEIHKIGNAKIAFIGLTLEGTPLIVTPAGVAGLEFRPEVPTINNLVAKLRADQGVRSFVVLIRMRRSRSDIRTPTAATTSAATSSRSSTASATTSMSWCRRTRTSRTSAGSTGSSSRAPPRSADSSRTSTFASITRRKTSSARPRTT